MSPSIPTGTSALSFTFSAQTLRVIMRDGEPWFVAADVCAALKLKDVSDAVEKLDADEKGRGSIPTLGGEQEMLIVNESGLNAIILRCRDAMTPGTPAHKYRKWVTAEVLPAIRKTGRYEAPTAKPPEYTRERLNGRDLLALRRVVWLIAHWFHHEQGWANVVHKHLRLSLGHPAPQPWHVDQLPAICHELTRVVLQAETAASAAREFEAECMRRIFKRGTLGDLGAAELLATSKARLSSSLAATTADVPPWLKTELQALTDRKQAVYVINDTRFDEQPETATAH
jgi:prophage antirepressor-like protein